MITHERMVKHDDRTAEIASIPFDEIQFTTVCPECGKRKLVHSGTDQTAEKELQSACVSIGRVIGKSLAVALRKRAEKPTGENPES